MSEHMPIKAQLAELRRKLQSLEFLRDDLGEKAVEQAKARLEERMDALIATGGGAAILGGATAGRDLIGRDKWEIILGDKHEYAG